MTLHHRIYRDFTDFQNVRSFVRRAAAIDPGANTWSFAHIDIWTARRLGDELVFGKRDWQENFAVWEEDGELVGAALYENRSGGVLLLHPRRDELAAKMLDWVEGRWAAQVAPEEPLLVEAFESNVVLSALLQPRGYEKLPEYMLRRSKLLQGTLSEPVVLPPGFCLKHIEGLDEAEKYIAAVKAVFGFQDCVAVHRLVHQSPSAVPELNLIALSGKGDVAAFCTTWVDWENSVSEFEPVGTVPDYQKLGLGAALVAEGSNRLRKLGIKVATVDSWSESPGANKLYERAGLKEIDRNRNWRKRNPVSS